MQQTKTIIQNRHCCLSPTKIIHMRHEGPRASEFRFGKLFVSWDEHRTVASMSGGKLLRVGAARTAAQHVPTVLGYSQSGTDLSSLSCAGAKVWGEVP